MMDTTGKYSFRDATKADQAWLTRLHQDSYSTLIAELYDEHDRAWQEGFFAARIGHPTQIVIISQLGQDVGAIYLTNQDDSVVLESLEISTAHQGKGAGSKALNWVCTRANATDRYVTLKVHKLSDAGRRFYERAGFSIVDEADTHYVMRLTLGEGVEV